MSELTTQQVAARFGVSPNIVWHWVKAGYLPVKRRFGRTLVFSEQDVARFQPRRARGRPKGSKNRPKTP